MTPPFRPPWRPAEPKPKVHRLSVNINTESADVLRWVTSRRGITATEAIRRAIALLNHFEASLDARENDQ